MKKLAIIICCVLYVICPIDLIPDFLLGPGQLDDLAAIALAVRSCLAESEKA